MDNTRNLRVGKKALITTDSWFVAPNGRQYRAVFGTVKRISTSEQTLGIKTNARSTNWYVEIGSMTIAGCHIHYGIRTEDCDLGHADDFLIDASGTKEYVRPSMIYDADEG